MNIFVHIILAVFLLQQATPPTPVNDTPLKTVEQFKATLDKSDLAGLCLFMAEDDASGPLKRIHYEQMQRSLENLMTMWRGQRFIYSVVEIGTGKQANQASIKVEVPNLSQQIKFVLLKFNNAWYIFDMEIYFK
ncbi:MAG TPA: hypothetical protein VNL36_00855 [Bacteroidota bacterium]|nr:hypothetical protein [Bacteroidota bacterium]